jgi:HEAT repeat protein
MDPQEPEHDVTIAGQQKNSLPNTDEVQSQHGNYLPNTDEVHSDIFFLRNILIRLGLTEKPPSQPLEVLNNPRSNWQAKTRAIQAFTELGELAPIDRIQECLKDAHEAVRMAAVRTLGELWRFGTVPLGVFQYTLRDKHPEVRATTVYALESLGSKALSGSLITQLIQKLQREDTIVRIAIIHLLGTLGKEAPIDELIKTLKDDNWQVREAAALTLGTLGDLAPSAPLFNAVYDRNRFVRDAVIFALGERLHLDMLIHDLRYGETRVREKAAQILGERGERTPEEPMIETLLLVAKGDSQGSVRKAAILALGQIEAGISLAELRSLLKDSEQDVRETAMIVIEGLYPDALPSLLPEEDPDSTDELKKPPQLGI